MSKGASRAKGTEGGIGRGSLVVEVLGWMLGEALGTRTVVEKPSLAVAERRETSG